jgi:hypothetical protein
LISPGEWLGRIVLLFVVGFALWELPGAVHAALNDYRAGSRFASTADSERFEESDFGVNADFVTFAGRHIPRGATFFVATGDSVTTNAPQAWLQFQLLPRIESYGSPCAAQWVVFYADSQVPPGLEIDKLITFLPGYAVGRVGSPCTP